MALFPHPIASILTVHLADTLSVRCVLFGCHNRYKRIVVKSLAQNSELKTILGRGWNRCLRHFQVWPLALRDPLPPAEYFVLLSRAENRPITAVWPLALRDPLGYDLAIDYTRSPEPPLDDPASSIAGTLLRTAGLRPA